MPSMAAVAWVSNKARHAEHGRSGLGNGQSMKVLQGCRGVGIAHSLFPPVTVLEEQYPWVE